MTARKVIWWTGFAVVAVAAGAVLYGFDPAHYSLYPVCLFHRLTGLDCPGCGSSRALHALLHGRLLEALHFNLLLVLSLPVFAFLGIRHLTCRLRSGTAPGISPRWLWWYLAAWVAFGIVRNLPVPILASFAP
jgi:hypothetical protein